jgi:hypothetical protein
MIISNRFSFSHQPQYGMTISIYCRLGEYLEDANVTYAVFYPTSASPTPSSFSQPLEDPSIDKHVCSGVYLNYSGTRVIGSCV